MDHQPSSDSDALQSEDTLPKVEMENHELEEQLRVKGSGRSKRIALAFAKLPVHSWSWFLMPMTSLGLSTLLHAQISLHNFHGLYTLGLIVYFIGFVEFFILLFAKLARRSVLKHPFSWASPEESLYVTKGKVFFYPKQLLTLLPAGIRFIAAFGISCYGVVKGAVDFSAPKPGSGLAMAFHALYWIYLAFAFCLCFGIYLRLFHGAELKSQDMTPSWLLPVLPVILVGVLAGSLVDSVGPVNKWPILIGGLFSSGLGLLFSLPIDGIYLHRLFQYGLPHPDSRPGMMIAVGPPSYVPLAFLKMASNLPVDTGFFATHPTAIEVLQIMAFFFAIPIFGLAILFFFMALGPILRRANTMSFHLTWYGLIFPNVGTLSTLGILAQQIPSDAITWVTTVATIILSGVWIFVTLSHAYAILKKSQNLW